MKRLWAFFFFMCVLHVSAIYGSADTEAEEREAKAESLPDTLPWLTGPLLTPSGHVVPAGFYNIEPYVYAIEQKGVYDKHWNSHHVPSNWSINPQLPIQIGLGKSWDCLISPQFLYNYNHGAHATRFGDLQAGVDYQILMDTKENWYPAVKVSLQETFPTGKYEHLSAHKKGTDISGMGAYTTNFALTFTRLFHFAWTHYLAARLYLGYTVSNMVHVRGINAYGGDPSTRGKVHPGNSFTALIGLEYTLTRHWALALDIKDTYINKTHFSGKTTTPVGSGSFEQISLAPAIEYNFNESSGLIAGVWFSVAGRNAPDFTSYVIAFNYYAPIRHRHRHGFHSHGGQGGKRGGKFS
jgi:hypothetical protein